MVANGVVGGVTRNGGDLMADCKDGIAVRRQI